MQAATGLGTPSRWGLRGTEDLGGGNSAVFALESGFNTQNGTLQQGGRLFGRQAYAGLANGRIGTLTLGRQYDAMFDMVGPFASSRQFVGMMGSHIGDLDNFYATFRLNNTVKYTSSPVSSGLTFSGMYGFSNQASGAAGTGFSNNAAWSTGLNYTNGKISAGAAYTHLSHPSSGVTNGSNTGGAVVGDYASPTDIFYNKAVSSHDFGGAGVSYQDSSYLFDVLYTYAQLRYSDGSSFHISNFELNGRYSFTPFVRTGLGVVCSQGDMQGTNLPGCNLMQTQAIR